MKVVDPTPDKQVPIDTVTTSCPTTIVENKNARSRIMFRLPILTDIVSRQVSESKQDQAVIWSCSKVGIIANDAF